MKNENYYTVNEIKDFNLLTLFNQKLKIEDLGQAPKKYYYDASGRTTTGQYIEFELKNRNGRYLSGSTLEFTKKNGTTYTASTIYIEPQHYSRMVDDFRYNNAIPMYVNFLNDDNMIITWNLSTLKNKPQWEFVTNIWDEGKRQYKSEWRILLPVEEAFIYDNNFNLIKRP